MKIIGSLSQNVCGSKPMFAFDENSNVFGSNCKPIAFALMKVIGNHPQMFLVQIESL